MTTIAWLPKLPAVHAQTTNVCMRALSMHIRTWQRSIRVSGLQPKCPTLCGGKPACEILLSGLDEYDEETFEKIFRRIYSCFGSSAPYTVFPDSKPFLRWLRGKGLKVGIVSNAEYRYRDVILPALGLNQGSEWDFGVFSGLEGIEKPDPKIYEIALERAGIIAPEEALHIGDSMRKDYEPAKSIGMHALLLDRFKTPEAVEWRKSGAVVLPDLTTTQEWLSSEKSAS